MANKQLQKDLEGSSNSLFKVCMCLEGMKSTKKNSIKRAAVLAKTETKHLPNTGLEYYR
jgi:hypothetical protein